jgi:GntR family transcriptional regulator
VIANRQIPNYVQKMRSLNELFEFAKETRLSILSTQLATVEPAVAELLGRRPGRQWLTVDAVRRDSAGRALNYSRIYLHEDFASLADELPDLSGPVYKLIEDRFGVLVHEVIQTITAEPFPGDVAKALSVRPGGGAVLVSRRYLGEGSRPIQTSMNWHPAEAFSYAMHMKRIEVR